VASALLVAFPVAALGAPPGDQRPGTMQVPGHWPPGTAWRQGTIRVSVASDGAQTTPESITFSPSISGNGRYVAFSSYATNLVLRDTNADADVFVRDWVTRRTTRISVSSRGKEGDGASLEATISADGRYVAFSSYATNLVPHDTNGTADVFLRDRLTGRTTRISTASDGTQGNDESRVAQISADGRYIAFTSWATNLVPGDTNRFYDAFVHDRRTGRTTRVSVASDGTQGNHASHVGAISPDGRYVTFASLANNLVPGDTNNPGPGFPEDAFVHDRITGRTTRVSVASDGTQSNGQSEPTAISRGGRYVLFSSTASNLVPADTNGVEDAFVHDRMTGRTTRVSVARHGTQANGGSHAGGMSADGRYVTFTSSAENLVRGDTNAADDVFVRDRWSKRTVRVSLSSRGAQANGLSGDPVISADGRYVAYVSSATNLVPGDTNDADDVFLSRRR
jgi:Tol biopolymer transport system component